MTEKRFELKWRDTGEVLYDNETGLEHGIYSPNYRFHVRDMMNELAEENQELKSKYSEQCIQLDFLKDENQHMRDLVNKNKQLQERNNRQCKQLDDLYRLIEEKDWRALSDIIDDFKKAEEQLQSEWKCYE